MWLATSSYVFNKEIPPLLPHQDGQEEEREPLGQDVARSHSKAVWLGSVKGIYHDISAKVCKSDQKCLRESNDQHYIYIYIYIYLFIFIYIYLYLFIFIYLVIYLFIIIVNA